MVNARQVPLQAVKNKDIQSNHYSDNEIAANLLFFSTCVN
jgi:hypothetical protein